MERLGNDENDTQGRDVLPAVDGTVEHIFVAVRTVSVESGRGPPHRVVVVAILRSQGG
jgi:hypothetical protein